MRKARAAPASFSDHFTQPRLFWLSMTPPEREHIVAAYSFELSKCQIQAVKKRTLGVLANIDPELCAAVAEGLGLPAPAATVPLVAADPSPALSQLGRSWPTEGRVIGIVADAAADPDGVRDARRAVLDAGVTPLVIAPTGGTLDAGGEPVPVQRTFAATRSVEYDALLFAGTPGAAADAHGARDTKAAIPGSPDTDPRVLLLLTEAYRHGKAIAAWDGADRLLATAALDPAVPGIALTDDATAAVHAVTATLTQHRAWGRFPPAG
ncbi:catalase-related domain-containing protein [Streptomyces yangpuensis]|uniref:catalase-related domain-containing protein n=1 Tax=Streptomyces yangpuensis TaxID=1648182 RepID=UPI003657EDA8